MIYPCSHFLSWSIQTALIPIAVVVGIILAVIVFIRVFSKNWITPDAIEPKHFNLVSVTEVIDYDHKTKKRIKAADIERMFREFKQSKFYASTVLYLINPQNEDKPDLNEMNKFLYVHFLDFRLYLRSVAPQMIDTDIDYCILTLAGFKQKDMYKLMNNITQSGVRNIKPRLKERLPAKLYHDFFKNNHEVY